MLIGHNMGIHEYGYMMPLFLGRKHGYACAYVLHLDNLDVYYNS